MVGGPHAGTAVPVSGKLTIKGAATNVSADIGKDGKYAIQLAPGRYRISATSPSYNNGGQCNTAKQPTVITVGKTVTADILCQMR